MRALPISMDFSLLVEIEGSVRYFFLFYFGELLGGSCTVRQFIVNRHIPNTPKEYEK